MLQTILSLLGLLPKALGTIDNITNAIANEKIVGINATTQQAKDASDERVAALQSQMQVLLADSKISSLDIWIRSGFAIGPLVYLNKIFLYDKVLGWGSTDPLDPNLWMMATICVGFYFVHSVFK